HPRARGQGQPWSRRSVSGRHRGRHRPDPEHLPSLRRLLAARAARAGDEGPAQVPPLTAVLRGGSHWTALLLATLAALQLTACGGNPPQIVDYAPQRGAVDVSTAAPIRITFDHAVDQPSLQSRIHLLPSTSGNVRWLNPRQLVFEHDTLRPTTAYEVVIDPGYKDLAGNTYTL